MQIYNINIPDFNDGSVAYVFFLFIFKIIRFTWLC